MSDPIDVRYLINNGYSGRYPLDPAVVDRVVIHHSVSGYPFNDPWPETEEQEIAHLRAIDGYHTGLGWGGFGYHLAAFVGGRSYYCGDLTGARAHVASQNHRAVGVVLIGTFTDTPPTPDQLQAAADAVAFARLYYPGRPIIGHRNMALTEYPTSCPGDTYKDWIQQIGQPGGADMPLTDQDLERIRQSHDAWHSGQAGPRRHTVLEGDNLWGLAVVYYGNGSLWPRIAQANGIDNPSLIHPGQELVIP